MTTQDFITELFGRVDDATTETEKHPQAELHPNEVVTLALLFAIIKESAIGRSNGGWSVLSNVCFHICR